VRAQFSVHLQHAAVTVSYPLRRYRNPPGESFYTVWNVSVQEKRKIKRQEMENEKQELLECELEKWN
jgi:hypothetical protein